MKRIFAILAIGFFALFYGYASAGVASKCCSKEVCKCSKGTCCENGVCKCPSAECCKNGKCICGDGKACKGCKCS